MKKNIVKEIVLLVIFCLLSTTMTFAQSLGREKISQFLKTYEELIVDVEKLAEIIKNKQENEIIEALKIIEPRIIDLQLVGSRIMVDVGLPTRLPINVLGDGVRKVLAVILSIYKCRNGILIIDELDNGLHFSVMPQLWEVILYMCQKHHTQIFASTHSLDLVKSLVKAIGKSKQPQLIASYKLIRKNDDELVALRYSAEELAYAIKQEMEVR